MQTIRRELAFVLLFIKLCPNVSFKATGMFHLQNVMLVDFVLIGDICMDTTTETFCVYC